MRDIVKIPMLSISPDRISAYETWSEKRFSTDDKQKNSLDNLKDNRPDPLLSESAKKRLKLAIQWLVFLAKPKRILNKVTGKKFYFQLAFITLTLSSKQQHSDVEIKETLLNTFLTSLRRQYKVVNYVWRAEKQENGNIHFHITLDKYIPWWELRDLWNRIQNNLGYTDRYHQKFRSLSFEQYCAVVRPHSNKSLVRMKKAYDYGCQTGWMSPNSTDIHSVQKVNDLAAYLTKYCTKEPEHGHIEGAQWRLSQSLSKFKSITEIIAGPFHDAMQNIFEKFKDQIKTYDYANVLYLPIALIIHESPLIFANLIDNYISARYG